MSMGTVLCIAGVVIGSAALEKRFAERGEAASARTVKIFGRWFLISAAGWVAFEWIREMLQLLI